MAKLVGTRRKCTSNFWYPFSHVNIPHKICQPVSVGERSSRNKPLVRIGFPVTALFTTRYAFTLLFDKRVFGSFCHRLFIVDRHHVQTFVQSSIFIAPFFFQSTPCFLCEIILDWSLVVSPSSALFRHGGLSLCSLPASRV